MIDDSTRPGDSRGFLHKRIAKFAGRLIGTGLQVVGAVGIPGVSLGARLVRSTLRGGARDPAFVRARAISRERQRNLRGQRRFEGQGQAVTPAGVFQVQARSGATPQITPTGDACPKGFHSNRSGYHLRDGTFVAPASRCVRNRRRNNDNGRAAMRAARRLLGRKKSQDAIDKALRAFAPRARRKSPGGQGQKGTTIVQN